MKLNERIPPLLLFSVHLTSASPRSELRWLITLLDTHYLHHDVKVAYFYPHDSKRKWNQKKACRHKKKAKAAANRITWCRQAVGTAGSSERFTTTCPRLMCAFDGNRTCHALMLFGSSLGDNHQSLFHSHWVLLHQQQQQQQRRDSIQDSRSFIYPEEKYCATVSIQGVIPRRDGEHRGIQAAEAGARWERVAWEEDIFWSGHQGLVRRTLVTAADIKRVELMTICGLFDMTLVMSDFQFTLHMCLIGWVSPLISWIDSIPIHKVRNRFNLRFDSIQYRFG